MKTRIVTVIMAIVLSAASVNAGNFDNVFDQFCNANHAEYVKVPSWLLRFGSWFADKSEHFDGLGIKGSISGCRVLDMSACNGADKAAFQQAVYASKMTGLEEIMRKGGSDKAIIWIKSKGKKIKKLYIFSGGESGDCMLVELSGNFRFEDTDIAD